MAKKKRVFKVNILSRSSIEQLQRDLDDYAKSLESKNEMFVRKLQEVGIRTARGRIDVSPFGKYIELDDGIDVVSGNVTAWIFARGETFQHGDYDPFNILMAVEFGAGIKYNPDMNPKAVEFGMGVGTYNEFSDNAFNPNGWYYWDEVKKKFVHSYGVKATMPMWGAVKEMREQIVSIAREVFSA